MKLLADAAAGREVDQNAFEAAAELLSYCAMGPDEYGEANGPWQCAAVEERLVAAFLNGDRSVDEELVLLTLCAGLMHPDVVELYGLQML